MYVIVSPVIDNQHQILSFQTQCGQQQYFDWRSNLFPLDRPLKQQNEFNTPNVNQNNAFQQYFCARYMNTNGGNNNNGNNYIAGYLCRNFNNLNNNFPNVQQENIYQPNSAVADVVIFHKNNNQFPQIDNDNNNYDNINQRNSNYNNGNNYYNNNNNNNNGGNLNNAQANNNYNGNGFNNNVQNNNDE